jgi:transposase-like protein
MSNIITITSLLNEARCHEEVRKLRWPDKITCPHCQSTDIVKKGYHIGFFAFI